MKNQEITPHFDEAVGRQDPTGEDFYNNPFIPDELKLEVAGRYSQRVTNVEGTTVMSMWLTPQTEKSAKKSKARTGRESYLPIDVIRDDPSEHNMNNINRIYMEFSKRHILESKNGTKLGIRVVNPKGAEGTIGVMSAWSTDAEWENVRGQVEALALMHPDKKIVFIETPGMGGSEKLSEDRVKQLAETGSYGPMAEQIAECLESSDIIFDVLVGTSEGGRIAISLSSLLMQRNPEEEITVVTVDPPGTDKRSLIKFAKGFAIDEGGMQKKVKEFSPDDKMVELHSLTDQPTGNRRMVHFKKHQLLPRVSAMRKAGLAGDVKLACSKGVQIFDFRSGHSAIANAKIAEELARKTRGYTTITSDGPHSIIEANPFALSLLLGEALSLRQAKRGILVDPAVRIARQRIDEDTLI